MIHFSLAEIFLRIIPEPLLFTAATYAFSKVKFDIKKFFLISITLSVIGCLARLLPVAYGINSLLSLIFLTLLNVKLNKVKVLKSAQVTVVIYILMFICEFINMLILEVPFHIDLNTAFKNPTLKSVYGIPNLVLFALFTFIIYKFLQKKHN